MNSSLLESNTLGLIAKRIVGLCAAASGLALMSALEWDRPDSDSPDVLYFWGHSLGTYNTRAVLAADFAFTIAGLAILALVARYSQRWASLALGIWLFLTGFMTSSILWNGRWDHDFPSHGYTGVLWMVASIGFFAAWMRRPKGQKGVTKEHQIS